MSKPVLEFWFLATPVPGDPNHHNMLMKQNGKVVIDGISNCKFCTAKTLVDRFRLEFPDVKITFIDRTVQ